MSKTIWLEVTQDKYELPLAVADTCNELAIMCNVSRFTIYACVSRAKNKGYKSKYIKVEVE